MEMLSPSVRGFAESRKSPPPPETAVALDKAAASLEPSLSDEDAAAFGAEVARCLEDHEDAELAEAVDGLHADDLWLAYRARTGQAAAVAELERRCIDPLGPTIGRVDASPSFVDEVRQRVRAKLLVAEPGKTPKLDRYRGRGDLATWIRVVAAREALSAARSDRHRADADDDLLALEASTTGPELGAVKAQYREAFAAAFREAILSLDPQQRNVLRLHYLHGLTVDDLAKLLGVHRSNAARRVAKIRSELLTATRRRLQASLRMGHRDFDDLMELIASRIDVSIERHLGD